MSKFTRNNLVAAVTALAVGALYVDRQKTKLSDATAFPAAAANGDQIQIGIVPAGMVLVPQHTLLQIPQLDTNGAPTGKYKIGTEASLAAVAAEQNGSAAVTLFGKDLVLTGTIGSLTDDVPLFLNVSAAIATQATAGTIVADLALRAFVPGVDS